MTPPKTAAIVVSPMCRATASLRPTAEKAAPFIVEAEAAPIPGNWPRAGVTMLKVSNRHLEYALTWFALAATLLIVFVVYARNRLASEAEGGTDADVAERGPSV